MGPWDSNGDGHHETNHRLQAILFPIGEESRSTGFRKQQVVGMVTAIVLVNVERGRVAGLAQKLADIQGISEVYSVGGRYDLVALIRVASNEELADLVTNHIAQQSEITHTETLLSFRSYSRHDLDSMFSVGM